MRTIFIVALIGLLSACQSNPNPQNRLPSEEKIMLNSGVDLPDAVADTISPQLWPAAQRYGAAICDCGKPLFPLYEEKQMSIHNNMSEAERGNIERKYEKKLNELRDSFRECRNEALAAFQLAQAADEENNQLTFRQSDSLKLTIMRAFDAAGCENYELSRALIFSDKNQSDY